MNLDQFRKEMMSYRHSFEDQAKTLKDSYITLDNLHSLYRNFDCKTRAMADQVLGEWVLSDDENLRFDALALIDDFRITTAAPALQELSTRLALSNAPGSPYELEKVQRILEDLRTQKG